MFIVGAMLDMIFSLASSQEGIDGPGSGDCTIDEVDDAEEEGTDNVGICFLCD